MRATAIFFFARVIRAAIVRLADQEGAGHLGRGQAAHQPQRERHLRRPVERGVAAGHDQPQPVVRDLVLRPVVDESRTRLDVVLDQQRQVAVLHAPVADDVQRPPLRRGGEPGARPRRDAAARPVGERGGEGVLHALLGDVEVARDAHRRGEHEGPLATVRVGDRGRDGRGVPGGHPVGVPPAQSKDMTGRTSTPPKRAGHVFATASAVSRSGASIR